MSTAILWFRRDLRLMDNPALQAAYTQFEELIPVYILEENTMGSASKVWLHHSLSKLQQSLERLGSSLILRQGDPCVVMEHLFNETDAEAVFWNRLYTPSELLLEARISTKLKSLGKVTHSFKASVLLEPWEVKTKTETPYKVFTPYWRRCLEQIQIEPELPPPEKLPAVSKDLARITLEEADLLPSFSWHQGVSSHWSIGENSAQDKAHLFSQQSMSDYVTQRDVPAQTGTSGLSPHLHFGEISPQQIWRIAMQHPESEGRRVFLSEIGWREFAHHILYHFPHTETKALNSRFDTFPWRNDTALLTCWQKGLTGYPLVDAGMRELWQTGWLHNRVRMIVASFLTKDLLLPWQVGAKWFWDTLVDADLACNCMGWQWAAGSGADAAPFFRIFNPITQSEKFDARGAYIRKWVPEIAQLPNKYVHKPWLAPSHLLLKAGVQMGSTYPEPIVDHKEARLFALHAFKSLN